MRVLCNYGDGVCACVDDAVYMHAACSAHDPVARAKAAEATLAVLLAAAAEVHRRYLGQETEALDVALRELERVLYTREPLLASVAGETVSITREDIREALSSEEEARILVRLRSARALAVELRERSWPTAGHKGPCCEIGELMHRAAAMLDGTEP